MFDNATATELGEDQDEVQNALDALTSLQYCEEGSKVQQAMKLLEQYKDELETKISELEEEESEEEEDSEEETEDDETSDKE